MEVAFVEGVEEDAGMEVPKAVDGERGGGRVGRTRKTYHFIHYLKSIHLPPFIQIPWFYIFLIFLIFSTNSH